MKNHKKITLSMPVEILNQLSEIAPRRGKSTVVAEAVAEYVANIRQKTLREELKKGYQLRAARNVRLAEEWRPLEEEVWRKYVKPVEDPADTK